MSFISIVQSHATWRWVFWVGMMIFAGVCTAIMIQTLPEKYAPVILHKAKRLRKQDPVKYKHLYAELEQQDWSM